MSLLPFRLEHARVLLARTPATLRALLEGLPDAWIEADDGPDTWSAHQVVAHLLDGERRDWTVRARTILSDGQARPFEPYDRDASLTEAAHRSLADLLDAFADARAENVVWLCDTVTEADLDRTGVHPALGAVTMRQLLATWVAHDHAHVVQIARTLARQYRDAVGPWAAYLSVFDG